MFSLRFVARALALAACAAVPVTGCVLARSGIIEQTCTTDADCDDGSPCGLERCTPEGLCEREARDGSAELVQVPFDCKQLVCSEGREVSQPDPGDVPDKPCVEASCTADGIVETPLPDSSPCTVGQGTGSCQGGECIVLCNPEDPASVATCDDREECTIDSCDAVAKHCMHEPLDNVALDDPPKNCQARLCLMGVAQSVPDDTDLPDDLDPCTEDSCKSGVPQHEQKPEGSPCGTQGDTLVCNEQGACVGCVSPDDCAGNDTDCQWRTCENNVCGVAYAAAGTPTGQNAPACKQVQCDGSGGTETVNLPNNTACNDMLHCNGNDSCLGGNCSQHSGDPCPGPDGDGDCSESCSETNDDCSASDPQGSTCNVGYCDGGGGCIDTCTSDPQPPGGSCPNVCNGGCTGKVCHIDCIGTDACKNLTKTCPAGFACALDCDGTNACRGTVLHCPANYACTTSCNGGDGCNNLTVNCSSSGGSCDLSCSTSNNVCKNANLSCGPDECTASCQGTSEPSVQCNGSCGCSTC